MAGGVLHLLYGTGRGKTLAAVGAAVRAAGAGRRVLFVSFDKAYDGATEEQPERTVMRRIERISVNATGHDRRLPDGTRRAGALPEDRREAETGLELARKGIESRRYELVVLDEIVRVAHEGVADRDAVDDLVRLHAEKGAGVLLLTGHPPWPSLLARARFATELRTTERPDPVSATEAPAPGAPAP